MITRDQILERLDNYKLGYYCSFIDLGHAYSYLIDSRINIFKGSDDRWAIVAERLGFNTRAGGIILDIYYFGNCLTNLENYNGQEINHYGVLPIDWNDFATTVDGEVLKPEARYWNVRGNQVELSHDKQDYLQSEIELKEYEPGEISIEEVGRLLIKKRQQLFRATDEELYKSIPKDLNKILVIDEWYHRDYRPLYEKHVSQYEINITYELSKQHSGETNFMDYDAFVAKYKQEEQTRYENAYREWEESRPSAYETWQLIADVIATGDTSLYKPTLDPNSNWRNWPDSGNM